MNNHPPPLKRKERNILCSIEKKDKERAKLLHITLFTEGKEYFPEEFAYNNASVWNTPRDRNQKRFRATFTLYSNK